MHERMGSLGLDYWPEKLDIVGALRIRAGVTVLWP